MMRSSVPFVHRLLTLAVLTAALAGRDASATPKHGTQPPAPHGPDLDAQPIALHEVLAVAVRQAPDLARASLDANAAEGVLVHAGAITDTTLTAGATIDHQRVGNQTTDVYNSDSATESIALSKLISTGATVGITATTKRTSAAVFGTQPFKEVDSELLVSVTQPLLRGIGAGATLAPIRVAQAQRDAATVRADQRARDLVRDIVIAYANLELAWRSLDARRSSLALAEKQQVFTQAAINVEKLPKSEGYSVEEAVATRTQDVIAAELAVWDRSLALRQLAGLEIRADQIAIRTSAIEQGDPHAPDVGPAIQAAVASNLELAALRDSERGAQASVDGFANETLPQLNLTVAGGPVGSSSTFSSSIDELHNGFDVNATLSLTYALSNSLGRGDRMSAHAQLLRAKVDTRQGHDTVAAQVVRFVQQIEAATTSLELGAKAVKLAEMNVEAEQRRLEAGRSSNNEVLRRQDELVNIRLREVSFEAQRVIARAQLEALTGTILTSNHITLH